MRIVALEEHMLTPAFAEACHSLSIAPAQRLLAQMEPALLDIGEARLRAMDDAGISMQVLSLAAHGIDALSPEDASWIAEDANNRIASAMRLYPDRFSGFATLALNRIDHTVDEARRAVEELGFCGLMLQGRTNGVFLDDEQFSPVWAMAENLGVPVYLHPSLPPPNVMQAYYSGLPERAGRLLSIAAWDWHAETGLDILRLIVSGIFDRFPGLRVIAGHLGEHLPSSIARAGGILDVLASQLRRPVEEYFHHHFWLTTSGYFTASSLQQAVETIGIDKMLFSVEYPFSSTQRGMRFLHALRLEPKSRELLAHGNADQLFGWGPIKSESTETAALQAD
jgi:predicted TIM-barrel fold metal-dependent hydrolase